MDDDDTIADLPEFPLFEMDDAEAAFGCDISRYVGNGYDDGKSVGYRLERRLRDEASCGAMLFYKGGKLETHGFTIKPGLERAKVYRGISALLKSFAPSHEQKMATVALAIHRWCDPLPASETKV